MGIANQSCDPARCHREVYGGCKEGSEVELENTEQAMRVFGEAGMPIARQRFEGDTFNHLITFYRSEHRAGISRQWGQPLVDRRPT